MKRLTSSLIVLVLLCITAVCASSEDGLFFYFNSADGVKWISSVSNLDGAFDSESGYYKLTNKNHDPNFQHNFSNDSFDTAEYPIVRYRFKIVSGLQEEMPYGQFFFKTDNGANMGDDGTYVNYPLENTDDWQDVVVDMRTIKNSKWSGKLSIFRVDPVQAVNGINMTVLVDHVAFFKNKEDAVDKSIADITYTYNNQTVFIPAGTMTAGDKETDFVMTDELVDETDKKDGYEPVILFKNADGSESVVALSYSNGKRFYYVARRPGEYRAAYYTKEYVDTSDHWALNYIRFVSARKLFGGTSETEFSPDIIMTRGMFVTVLGRMHGIDASAYSTNTGYADVNSNEYYAPYISWASELKIAAPIGEGTFEPEEPITRADMAQILANYAFAYGYKLADVGNAQSFVDIAELDTAMTDAIKKMQKAGIINGKGDGKFDPQGISTRAEVATVMARIIKSVLGLPLNFEADKNAKSIILNLTSPDGAKNISVYGDGDISNSGEGLTITGYSDQFYLRYYPDSDMYIEDYPYVKICYKINSSPSSLAQFYYYTDKTVTEELAHPYVQFTLAGEVGEWNTMSFDFSTIEKINAMPASSGSAWEGKLENFAIYPLRMFSSQEPTKRDMILKYIAFFSDEESMNRFDESQLEYNGTFKTEEELMISENLGKQDRIHIGAFFPYHVSVEEKDIAELAEAGIDISFVGLNDVSVYAQKHLLDWHAKYGVMAWMYDGSLRGATHVYYSSDRKSNITDTYGSHPAFYGNIFSDEPGIVHYEGIGKYVKEYYNDFPDKIPFVNLLPMYASNDQLTYGASVQKIDFYDTPAADFEDYVRRYAEAVDTPYISTDIYPLRWNVAKQQKETYKDYVKSIEVVAKVCRETGREFWCYIQSFDSKGRAHFRAPEKADIRWQAYSMLSFGIKTMLYYVWHGPSTSDYTATPINEQGEKNAIWYAAKEVNNEFIAISPVYLQYKNIGAFTHNAESKPYAQMLEPLESFAPIAEVKCDETLLIGCFEKQEGEGYAFTVVNMSEMYDNKTVSVSLKLNGKTVTSYFGGKPQAMTPDANGYYSFELVCGDGVFITVD